MASVIEAPVHEKEAAVSTVRALDRALDLLVTLGKSGRPLGLAEVSRAASLHMTTAQRLLTVLERRQFVQRDRGLYQLGPGIVPLASAFLSTNSLTRSALPVQEELVAITGETASLYVRQGFERIMLQRVETPNQLRYTVRVGERFPLSTGSSGQVLAAGMSAADLQAFLDQADEVRFASGRILSKDEMRARIERVRQRGFAVGRNERTLGIASVAAPVLQAGGETIAALAVTGPVSRLTEDRITDLSVEVRRAAAEISRRFRSA